MWFHFTHPANTSFIGVPWECSAAWNPRQLGDKLKILIANQSYQSHPNHPFASSLKCLLLPFTCISSQSRGRDRTVSVAV